MTRSLNAFLTAAEEATRAGAVALRDWRGRVSAREKAPSDLVTEADLASEQRIREVLLARFPTHQVIGEEGAQSAPAPFSAAEYSWIVDPLDGTTNFVHQVPHYCVSVALARQGEVLVGAVFDPCADECYTAAAGQGARLNGRPLTVSGVTRLSEALVAVSFPPRATEDSPEVQDFMSVLPYAQAIRRTGSAALNICYIAAGRFDAYSARESHPWDIAAGLLILREAGGLMTAYDGGALDLWRPKFIASSTQSLHTELVRLFGRNGK